MARDVNSGRQRSRGVGRGCHPEHMFRVASAADATAALAAGINVASHLFMGKDAIHGVRMGVSCKKRYPFASGRKDLVLAIIGDGWPLGEGFGSVETVYSCKFCVK